MNETRDLDHDAMMGLGLERVTPQHPTPGQTLLLAYTAFSVVDTLRNPQ